MAISDTITSMYENVGNVYDVLELAGADLTNVDKNIENLKQAWEERLLYFLANGTDVVWNNWLPKVNGSGETITLNNTIEAKMDFVYKGNTSQKTTTGKNLFDVNLVTSVTNGTISDEIITTNETSNSTYSVFPYFSNISLPANTYYLSMDIRIKSGTGNFNKINDAATEWTAVNKPSLSTTFQRYVYSHTYTSVTTLNHILIQFISSTNAVYEITNIMLSTSSDTNYEKYTGGNPAPNPDYPQDIQVVTGNNSIRIANNDNTQSVSYPINIGNIELCKIGDYQDKIYKDNGKWYLNKQIGKVVLNGSEDWAISNNIFYRTQSSYVGVGYNTISNYFIGGPNQASTTNVNNYNPNNSICCASSGTNRFYIKTNIASTTTDFKTWLSTHNTTVYYVLATPTTTEITDTTLISQLEAIKKSYNEQTNISQTNDDMPFILDVLALGN